MLEMLSFSVFGFELTIELLVEVIIVNGLIIALAMFGFSNLRKYIKDIQTQIKRIRDKRKEL